MGKQIVANIGVATAAVVAFLWVLCLLSGMHWVSSTSVLINFEANLLAVQCKKGALPTLVAGVGFIIGMREKVAKLDNVLGKRLWMEDALQELCRLDGAFRWCNMWTMVSFASWTMFAAAVLTIFFLVLGGFFMYYYSNVHATTTGRVSCKVCYALAPVTATLGLIIYTCCTQDFGEAGLFGQSIYQAKSMYAAGWVFAWALSFFSWVPLYTMAVFMRRDPLEKKHWEEEEERYMADQQQAYAATYGAANPYGAPAQAESMMPQNAQYAQAYTASTSYVGQSQQYGAQSQQYGAPSAPPMSGGGQWGGQPGYGTAAW